MPTPKYKVRPDTGELQEYLFEYNGILALKNFVARVDGERLILHSAEDMNFSILDALVSEVEINGVVYDNADAAQQALQRLTFNTNRPVIMTQRERELLLGALQSGNYVGTAADLKSLIDGKVDKEAGKGLSTNDFTNAYKQKLDTLEDYDIELDENTTELRFKKGSNVVRRISLMFLDDEGTKLVYNKPEKTLELRDKRNNLLTSIPVSHFVSNIPDGIVVQNGKIKLMAGNNVIFENAFSYNDLADKPNLNFAPASHRHNWDDIDGKPEMVTEEKITEVVKNIKIGGRNYALNSKNKKKLVGYVGAYWELSEPAVVGKTYTFSCYANIENGRRLTMYFVDVHGQPRQYIVSDLVNGYNQTSVTPNYAWTGLCAFHEVSGISPAPTATIEKIKFEIGDKATDWSPAPEDIRIATEISGERQVFPNENIVYVTANTPNCDLQLIPSGYSVAFRKVFAGGQVTFTCTGKQIIYTGDNAFNGGDGSTAVVSIWNNKCYIDIRNI
jgi:hypothetical protein